MSTTMMANRAFCLRYIDLSFGTIFLIRLLLFVSVFMFVEVAGLLKIKYFKSKTITGMVKTKEIAIKVNPASQKVSQPIAPK